MMIIIGRGSGFAEYLKIKYKKILKVYFFTLKMMGSFVIY